VILSVLLDGGHSKTECHHQEKNARYLKPKLMKDTSEGPGGGATCGHGSIDPPAATRHLADHA